jgi:acyl-CoA reductase-like NAD-dependent aldehyde dehydrogenase
VTSCAKPPLGGVRDQSIATEVTLRVVHPMGAMTIGRRIDDGVQVRPLVDRNAVNRFTDLVSDAVEKGTRFSRSASQPLYGDKLRQRCEVDVKVLGALTRYTPMTVLQARR